jgi:hypothetical protein
MLNRMLQLPGQRQEAHFVSKRDLLLSVRREGSGLGTRAGASDWEVVCKGLLGSTPGVVVAVVCVISLGRGDLLLPAWRNTKNLLTPWKGFPDFMQVVRA